MAPETETVLVSACLLGCNCRYDAVVRVNGEIVGLPGLELVPVCPEVAGGLPTPRPAADIVEGEGADVLEGRCRVVDEEGRDVTQEFVAGAHAVLEVARRTGARRAILKGRSPSCGMGQLAAEGGSVRPGNGVTAELLRREGLVVESADFTVDSSESK